ncbi:hypothetical protein C0Q70_04344 [Pomacea canaliculata]|uniref:C-type lectin domain-containing protein n=1 Tax=Pomacea canaliculata TaxID=400727 RepID=A0A2T7PV93_POMCA|nr:hypothetical protein C0Q70_04344 [Pomacea canaliculata]
MMAGSPRAGQVCPYGWYGRPGSDSCYLINTDSTKYKWPDAVDKCQAYNGQLVVISDTQERSPSSHPAVTQQLPNSHPAVTQPISVHQHQVHLSPHQQAPQHELST